MSRAFLQPSIFLVISVFFLVVFFFGLLRVCAGWMVLADEFMKAATMNEAKWRNLFGFAKPDKEAQLLIYTSPEDTDKMVEVLNVLRTNGHSRVQVVEGGARLWNKHENPNF